MQKRSGGGPGAGATSLISFQWVNVDVYGRVGYKFCIGICHCVADDIIGRGIYRAMWGSHQKCDRDGEADRSEREG